MQKMRVLYIDDEPDLLELGQLFLEKNGGFQIDTAESAKTALDILRTTKYDAIISDYQMPMMDGIAFLKEVRSQFGAIPFILFTGRGREEVVVEALNSGADFYLQKGGDPDIQFIELSHKIHQAVSRHRAEQSLFESESRFRDLTENSLDTIMLFDRDLHHLYVNPNAEIQTGIPAAQFIGKTHEELGFPSGLVQFWDQKIRDVFVSGKTGRNEFQLPSGIWIDWMLVPVKNSDGTVAQVITSARDISERKKAEEQIRLAEFSLEHSGVATFWFDENAKVIRANLAACDALGYTPEEFYGFSVQDFDPNYGHENWKKIWKQIAESKYWVIESVHQRKDGSVFPVEIASSYFEYSGKKLIFSFARDISERKKAEDEIRAASEQIQASEEELRANFEELAISELKTRESERRLADIINFLPDPTYVIDLSGKVIAWNRAMESLVDVPAGEVLGKGNYEHAFRMFGKRRPVLVDLVIHGDETVIKKHYPTLRREGENLAADLEIQSLKGGCRMFWITATRLYNERGEITGAIESMRDITQLRQAQAGSGHPQRERGPVPGTL